MFTVVEAGDELEALVLAVEEEELLQAAAARHKATADVTTAPFLAIGIIGTTLRHKREVPHSGMRYSVAGLAELRRRWRLNRHFRTPEINVALTSAAIREDTVNSDLFVLILIRVRHPCVIYGRSRALSRPRAY
jgi:hypothetical protein